MATPFLVFSACVRKTRRGTRRVFLQKKVSLSSTHTPGWKGRLPCLSQGSMVTKDHSSFPP